MANLHQYPVSGVWPSRVAGIGPGCGFGGGTAGVSEERDHTAEIVRERRFRNDQT